jgi:uncharacterized lipoprotein YbaY
MTMTRTLPGLLLVPVLALALAACQSTPTGASSGGSAASASEHAITGTATYLERIKMPPGASLRVQLIDNRLADTPKAVLSEMTMKDVAGPPYRFTLPYDPSRLRDGGVYGLSAALYGPDGQLWFITHTREPFDPIDGTPVELRMQRVPGPGEAQAGPAAADTTRWNCGDLQIGATFDAVANTTVLALPGRSLSLPHAVSASGARFADSAGNEFWSKGDSAMLTLAGRGKRNCSRTDID